MKEAIAKQFEIDELKSISAKPTNAEDENTLNAEDENTLIIKENDFS